MDDFQLILSIIFGVIYFLYQALAGSRKRKRGQQPQQEGDTAKPAGKSFEDFLREISGEPLEEEAPEIEEQVPQSRPKQRKAPTVSESAYQAEENDSYSSYQGVVDKPKKLVKLDDQVDIDDAGSLLKKVEALEQEEEAYGGHPILNMLKNSDSARNAIIMGEIFNKKSF